MAQIVFDASGESHVFQIGEDRIYFERECLPDKQDERFGDIFVAHSQTGEPYSRTNQYIRFDTADEAERFLAGAQAESDIPFGWQ